MLGWRTFEAFSCSVATPAWVSTEAPVTSVVLDSWPDRSATSTAYSSRPVKGQWGGRTMWQLKNGRALGIFVPLGDWQAGRRLGSWQEACSAQQTLTRQEHAPGPVVVHVGKHGETHEANQVAPVEHLRRADRHVESFNSV